MMARKLRISKRVFRNTYSKSKYLGTDPLKYISIYFNQITNELKKSIDQYKHIKFQLCLCVKLKKRTIEGGYNYCEPYFLSNMTALQAHNQVKRKVREAADQINSHFESFIQYSSGWQLQKIKSLVLEIVKVKLFRGGCSKLSTLPLELKNTRALLDIHCPIGECFAYSVAGCLLCSRSHPKRSRQYKAQVKKFAGNTMRMPIKSIKIYGSMCMAGMMRNRA